MAGLTLVVDLAVNSFLASGKMPELMYRAAGYKSFKEFEYECRFGLSPHVIDNINKYIKNCKIKVDHLGHWRRARELGPPADHELSKFEFKGEMITVATYFEMMCQDDKFPMYRNALPRGKLQYIKLPTINIGSRTNPVLIPAELISVPGGQARSNIVVDNDMSAVLIRQSTVKPTERLQYIKLGDSRSESILHTLKNDTCVQSFGLKDLSIHPHEVPGLILPQAKLCYKFGNVLDPGLSGSWNIDKPQVNFFESPPNPNNDGSYSYGVLIIGIKPPPEIWEEKVNKFCRNIEKDGIGTGVKLFHSGQLMISNGQNESLMKCLLSFKSTGIRIAIVIMCIDSYGKLKLVSDKIGIPTQCIRWKNIDKPPRGLYLNLLMKINTKLGGTNHTLISRGQSLLESVFQDPPVSISWLFDQPCMLVGIDITNADPGGNKESMAAVVASMDGRASQYVAHLSAQSSRVKIVSMLQEAMVTLLKSFRDRNNGMMPCSIVVFRCGVSDGQFEQIIEKEVTVIKDSVQLMGYEYNVVKIAVVVCQKGHHTRIVYNESQSTGHESYLNPCPGLVVDATGGSKSISGNNINEFYLNSHVAIQGTSKPSKYSLIFDEIGFKLSELELLTYWTTYLSARCSNSISYATPAYYAHWASKRARDLISAGGCHQDLLDISLEWSKVYNLSTMFFI